MNKIKTILTFWLLLCVLGLKAQSVTLSGKVVDGSNNSPLPGATVLTEMGEVSLADVNGRFSVVVDSLPQRLMVSFVGFIADTLKIEIASDQLLLKLYSNNELREAEIVARKQSTEISTLNPRNIEILNEGELLKAACCNLAESFETNPSVDVNYTDAVTGAREIQLLGLSGIYTQMLGEAIPTLRGMANPYGLLYIPGSWMESIQISKGTSSVANGYEGITGQINVEFKKPLKKQPLLHLNVYGDAFGRGEVNAIYTMPLKKAWNYMLMAHGSGLQTKNDHNGDDFLDMPLFKQLNVYNRFHFNFNNLYEGQLGVKALSEERTGGNTGFSMAEDRGTTRQYGFRIRTQRIEAYSKTGMLFPDKAGKTMGLQASGILHQQNAFFGLKEYDGRQVSFYSNAIYMNTLGDANHKLKAGLDYKRDEYSESVDDSAFSRIESVPGAYAEYTYGGDCESIRLGLIAGGRIDYHNLFGWLFTPRVHIKYNFTPEVILRASAGRGYRTPNTYADNIGLFVSAKELVVLESPRMEDAWNGGLNLTTRFMVWGREGSLMLDAYHTRFNNQWMADQYSSPAYVYYYNLEGQSTAHSLQATFTFNPFAGFDFKVAWRFDDVEADYRGMPGLAKPLISRNKALVNAAWTDRLERWRLDATLQWEGPKPLPLAAEHEHGGGHDHDNMESFDQSPDYFQLMAQATRIFKNWEVYVGGENLLNYTQHQVILGSDNPFGDTFDATRVWGPVMGTRIYAGIRLNIQQNTKP